MNNPKAQTKMNGFTIVEVLIAALIMYLFASSFTRIMDSSVNAVRTSKQLTRSVIISRNVIEEMRSVPFSDIFVYNGKKFDAGKGSIRVRSSGNDMATITVMHGFEMNTIRSRY